MIEAQQTCLTCEFITCDMQVEPCASCDNGVYSNWQERTSDLALDSSQAAGEVVNVLNDLLSPVAAQPAPHFHEEDVCPPNDPNTRMEPGAVVALSDLDPAVVDLIKETSSNYAPLRHALQLAYLRACEGKGKERHAPSPTLFTEQDIYTEIDEVGPGGAIYQIRKKAKEAQLMNNRGDPGGAMRECLDIIVYAAALVLWCESQTSYRD